MISKISSLFVMLTFFVSSAFCADYDSLAVKLTTEGNAALNSFGPAILGVVIGTVVLGLVIKLSRKGG